MAIPQDAAWVSVHKNMAGQWSALQAAPLGRFVAEGFGLKGEVPKVPPVFDALAGKEVALAYVPNMGRMNTQAWVFSSWIGARAPWLRWYLRFRCPAILKPMHPMAGWPIWRVDLPADVKGTLSVAIVDGLLVGAYAIDPAGVRDVLMVVDGCEPSVETAWLRPGVDHQWAWYDQGRHKWSGILDKPASSSPRLSATRAAAVALPAPSGTVGDPAVLEQVFGGYPELALRISGAWAAALWPDPAPLWWSEFTERWADFTGDADLTLFVLGGEYSGRFNGIKIPALVAACPWSGAAPLEDNLGELLDDMNRQHRLGLVLRALEGLESAWSIEGTEDDRYGRLVPSEQVAVAQYKDWLLLASSASVLESLLANATGPSAQRAPWVSALSTPEPLAGWADSGPAGDSLRVALAGMSLHLSMSDPAGSQQARMRLREFRNWTKGMAFLGQLFFSVSNQDPLTFEVRVEAPKP